MVRGYVPAPPCFTHRKTLSPTRNRIVCFWDPARCRLAPLGPRNFARTTAGGAG